MRIVQIIPWLSYGDGIGNTVRALHKIIKDKGFESSVYASSINDKTVPAGDAFTINNIGKLEADDILISHVGSDSFLNEYVKTLECRKIMFYHNVTPPHFFSKYNKNTEISCKKAYREVKNLKNTFDLVLTPSNFNCKDLQKMRFSCPIKILPPVIPFNDYKKTPSDNILKKYNDGYTNIIFVGRVAPHKKFEDIIKAFYEYQHYFNQNSRLILVGSSAGFENYERQLRDYISLLDVKNVIFTGHIKFDEILAYYHLSDLFLCQSEHEGFCIPLAEAMFFEKPILAYDSSAIAETLGEGGFVLKKKNSLETAAVINKILTDENLKKNIIENQNKRLADFQYDKLEKLFWSYMGEFIDS